MSDFRVALPAAGASRRMRGRDKLLETVDGRPLLRRQAEAALTLGRPVAVAVAPGMAERRRALAGLDVKCLEVTDAKEGIAASLRVIARWARPSGLMLLLPDVPGIGAAELAHVARGWDGDGPRRASDPEGRPGTPLLLPARLLPRLAEVTGDDGGRAALEDEPVELLRFDDRRATRDLDTPEDWADWRAGG